MLTALSIAPDIAVRLIPKVAPSPAIPGIASIKRQCQIGPSRRDLAGRPIGKFLMASSNDYDPLDAEAVNFSGIRILVVEDSWHIGVALKSLLRSYGAEVAGPVASSAEAEQLMAAQVPDIAIVDFNLRGGELAHGLIDKLNELGTPVILVTGYAAVPVPAEKAAAILQKPIVEAQLLAALQATSEPKAAG